MREQSSGHKHQAETQSAVTFGLEDDVAIPLSLTGTALPQSWI